jgi:PDZ domain-containing protein
VLLGAVLVLGLAIGLAYMPVPYVALEPGETVNVLGTDGKHDIITVSGAQVSKSKGQLRLVTVGVYDKFDLVTAMRLWHDDDAAVVPREYVYPPDKSRKEVERQDKADFTQSQSTAQAAAFRALGYDDSKKPTFTVSFDLAGIGGPSAGLMFALGTVDKLSAEDLTGGRIIAGTGEISADGKVDPIGGIAQKMRGARRDGSTVFLTPVDNCADAVKNVPKGLRLVKVSSLDDALSALRALRDGGHNNEKVQSC